VLTSGGKIGAPGAVILSYGFWQRSLDADPGVIVQDLVLDEVANTVAGVPKRPTRRA
jgi:hypothetical protein